jgi:hypothetical protein
MRLPPVWGDIGQQGTRERWWFLILPLNRCGRQVAGQEQMHHATFDE